ncbi:hypothetical protein evm_008511 [Chilo suppressalis]|nr:hypothetical protein evm_008511 [Chilo suppressalis]
MSLKTIQFIVFFIVAYSYASNYDDEYGPEYGTQWLWFLDDDGDTHQMNFSSLPQDTRGLLLGQVYFYLYTRKNVEDGELLTLPKNESPIQSEYFNESNNIRAVTHGWLTKETTAWLQSIKNTLLKTADLNVITIDWHEIAQNPMYPWPALSTRYVGKRMAKLIKSLYQTYNMNNTDIHLIGHSLGAQVMGYAGFFAEQKIHRITGLDPARPLFELPMMPHQFRLDKSDADFVDIIHTCAGVLGYKKSHGHANFYPNGGKPVQPGCGGHRSAFEACSHGRSHEFFLESIDSTIPFTAYPCESWDDFTQNKCQSNATPMGYNVRKSNWGDFYLHTKNESKYAMGDKY